MAMFADIPVDVSPAYTGERIRREEMYAEFGGTAVLEKFELARVRKLEEVEDEKVTIIGPDINELKEGGSYGLGIVVEAAGAQLEPELEGVIERKIHEYINLIEGFTHLNSRDQIWLRLSKRSFRKGLNSFNYVGKVITRLYKLELPIVEKAQITFISDPAKISELIKDAREIYEARDVKARALRDEDVDVFYGCTLCQSFAPTHVCIITPQRYSNCGSISWFDGRAAARVDPKGPVFVVPKGELLNPVGGEYSGVNEMVKKKSYGENERYWIYSMFEYPHTSCGCFECIAFYIPEVDGVGLVHRGYRDVAVNGMTFGALAEMTAGGRQIEGFHGCSIEYIRSPKFLQADGGWERVVWATKDLKEKMKGFVSDEILEKVPTEVEVKNVDQLKEFLKGKGHPILKRMAL